MVRFAKQTPPLFTFVQRLLTSVRRRESGLPVYYQQITRQTADTCNTLCWRVGCMSGVNKKGTGVSRGRGVRDREEGIGVRSR